MTPVSDPFGPCADCQRFYNEAEIETCDSCCFAVCKTCWGDDPHLCKACTPDSERQGEGVAS